MDRRFFDPRVASRITGAEELLEPGHGERRDAATLDRGIERIWEVMESCIDRGLTTDGILPGGLKVARRAPDLWDKLTANPQSNEPIGIPTHAHSTAVAANGTKSAM